MIARTIAATVIAALAILAALMWIAPGSPLR